MPVADIAPRAVVAIVLAAAAAVSHAAEPEAGGSAPTTRLSREELVRKWDLNSDGKIDPGEAEVASSRMRRERAEMRLNTGIDPVTGRPRGEEPPPEPPQPPDLDEVFGSPTEAAEEKDVEPERERPALPGTRVPRVEAPRTSRPRLASPSSSVKADPPPQPPSFRQPITGGVRAGGIAARPGYGSRRQAAPLNAGRPIDSIRDGFGGIRGPTPAAARGGLLPQPRPVTPRPTRDIYDPY